MQGPQSQAVGWPWSGIFNERVNLLRGDYSGASSVTKWRIQVWDKQENSGFEGAVGWQQGSPEVKLCDARCIWAHLTRPPPPPPSSVVKRKRKVGGGRVWLFEELMAERAQGCFMDDHKQTCSIDSETPWKIPIICTAYSYIETNGRMHMNAHTLPLGQSLFLSKSTWMYSESWLFGKHFVVKHLFCYCKHTCPLLRN